jgi:hypothetical protein
MIYIILPEVNKRVLVWVEDEEYPFVGYWNGREWNMETSCLDYDTYRSSIFGDVVRWMDLPKKPTGVLGAENKNSGTPPQDETGDIVNLKWEAVSEIRPDGIIISSDEAGCICELVLKGRKS